MQFSCGRSLGSLLYANHRGVCFISTCDIDAGIFTGAWITVFKILLETRDSFATSPVSIVTPLNYEYLSFTCKAISMVCLLHLRFELKLQLFINVRLDNFPSTDSLSPTNSSKSIPKSPSSSPFSNNEWYSQISVLSAWKTS